MMVLPEELAASLPGAYTDLTDEQIVIDPDDIAEVMHAEGGIYLATDEGDIVSYIDDDTLFDLIVEWHNKKVTGE